MVRMGFGRCDPAPSIARAREYVGDIIEATVSCRLDQRVAVQPQLVRVRTRVKQESHGLEMPFTDCETQGRILSRQRGIAFEQTTELEHVTVRCSGDRIPHILSAVRVELGWPNHKCH